MTSRKPGKLVTFYFSNPHKNIRDSFLKRREKERIIPTLWEQSEMQSQDFTHQVNDEIEFSPLKENSNVGNVVLFGNVLDTFTKAKDYMSSWFGIGLQKGKNDL